MPLGEALGNHRRINRTIMTRDRLAGRERQLSVVRQPPFVAIRNFNRKLLPLVRDAESVANSAAENATENLVTHKISPKPVWSSAFRRLFWICLEFRLQAVVLDKRI